MSDRLTKPHRCAASRVRSTNHVAPDLVVSHLIDVPCRVISGPLLSHRRPRPQLLGPPLFDWPSLVGPSLAPSTSLAPPFRAPTYRPPRPARFSSPLFDLPSHHRTCQICATSHPTPRRHGPSPLDSPSHAGPHPITPNRPPTPDHPVATRIISTTHSESVQLSSTRVDCSARLDPPHLTTDRQAGPRRHHPAPIDCTVLFCPSRLVSAPIDKPAHVAPLRPASARQHAPRLQ